MKALCLIGLLLIACPKSNDRMEISYVNMDIDTMISVDCSEFEDYFSSIIKTINISEQETIENIWNLLQRLALSETKHNSPDTRMKIRIWKGGLVHIICIDRFYVLFNGKMYVYDDEFRLAIEDIIESHTD